MGVRSTHEKLPFPRSVIVPKIWQLYAEEFERGIAARIGNLPILGLASVGWKGFES